MAHYVGRLVKLAHLFTINQEEDKSAHKLITRPIMSVGKMYK